MLGIMLRGIALFGISCYLVPAAAQADQLKMECQVWQAVGAKEPVGTYTFLFDPASGSLSVNMQSSPPPMPMFGFDVKQWKLLFAQGSHAIFYGITPKGLTPVQIFSLNFEKPNMFSYWVGGDAEEFTAGAPQYNTNCRRLN